MTKKLIVGSPEAMKLEPSLEPPDEDVQEVQCSIRLGIKLDIPLGIDVQTLQFWGYGENSYGDVVPWFQDPDTLASFAGYDEEITDNLMYFKR